MRIKEISLKNFKRFTDLAIKDIPESAKLVLLIGANGSGKSSVFDAFEYYNNSGNLKEDDYYARIPSNMDDLSIEFVLDKGSLKTSDLHFPGQYMDGKGYHDYYQRYWDGTGIFNISTNIYNPPKNVFYGRSSMRIVSRIPLPDLQESITEDADRPEFFIDQDVRFNTDIYEYIREINTAIRSPFFNGEKADIPTITQEYLTKINDSFLYIFGNDRTSIRIVNMVDSIPGVPAQLLFQKGESKINYDLLSHGEKQIVTLLLNFVIRNKYYQDTIYFIDEMDTHLETSIQKRLIENVVEKWIPEGSQLWTASHALGFIEYANKAENAVILDFDSRDFDLAQVIRPSQKNNLEVYEIAIPKEQITSILSNYKLVVVENQDDKYYNAALGRNGFLFLPAYDSREVFLTIKGDNSKLGLRDQDYLMPAEIDQVQKKFPNLKVLKYYSFENYIYHPDNISELHIDGFDKAEYIAEIKKQKNEKLVAIASRIETARTHYSELKESGIVKSKDVNQILTALQSDEFEMFYQYFDIKSDFGKDYLSKFNITKAQLAQTKWFNTQIKGLLV